ncbi:MAG: hypothetical protein KTR20_08475 [Cellvibrionaceae bacterium]|nr:hypothetical protein [Cellvibrionaceae bacterium]
MNLEYYIINGRGDGGVKFQLAKLKDSSGNNFKGQYDMSRQFASIDELRQYIAADIVQCPEAELQLSPMNI